MEMKAYHFSKRLHLKSVNLSDLFSMSVHSPSEIVLQIEKDKFIFIFNFGSIVCFNLNTEELDRYVGVLSNRMGLDRNAYRFDDLLLEENTHLENSHKIEFSKVILKELNYESIRVAALLLGESVALDYHQSVTTELLVQTKKLTDELRDKGRSSKSHKELVKYIGSSLSTKQTLIDDLYIFDEPDETWDDLRLSKLWEELRRHLELQSRFRSIEYDLDVIQESTAVIADLVNSKYSNRLELTIVLLITFEIVKSFISS
jgi:uncharacterized Rmd1/YagE family protein